MPAPLAGPSNQTTPRSISGTTPGILDPSQPSRLLRLPTATLSFASFDPRTAYVDGNKGFPNLPADGQSEHYRPKRIVIETTPNGENFWRFVPRARKEDGVWMLDEGTWPRVVEICGEQVLCTQDQWDIYKLDSEYDCIIQSAPKLSIISRVTSRPATAPVPPKISSGKRRQSPPQLDASAASMPKKSRQRSMSASSSVSSGEEDMSVDDAPRFQSKSARARRRANLREQHEQNRKARREKIMRSQIKQNHIDDEHMFSPSEDPPKPRFQSMPTDNAGKRKDIHVEDDDEEAQERPFGAASKRTRTTSPRSARRSMEERRAQREIGKQKRWGRIMENRKVDRDRRFMNGILEEVPNFKSMANSPNGFGEHLSGTQIPPYESNNQNDATKDHMGVPRDYWQEELTNHSDDGNARRSALAESIRKLQELEKDKPLWDEAAKLRMQRETAEEDERRAKAEERRRAAAWQAELEKRAKAEREAQETRAQAETERRQQEAAAKRAREQRRQERHRWESGPWTTSRALDRYKTLSETFDCTKFSLSEPLGFQDVPWPVLHAPMSFDVEDIDWSAVEKFFEAVRPYLRGDEYKALVEKSHRRFHPDRWKSRRLLGSVVDDGDRECMEVAANTVAQALTPLWRNVK